MKRLHLTVELDIDPAIAEDLQRVMDSDMIPLAEWVGKTNKIIEKEIAFIQISDVKDWDLW